MMDAGRWRAIGVSLRGSSHVKTGQPCQDYHAFVRLPGGALIAALADGAGTAELSQVGAEIAVNMALETLRCHLEKNSMTHAGAEKWRSLLGAAMQGALSAVQREAARRAVPERELASTLSLAVAFPGMIAAAQVGDGAVVAADSEGKIHTLLRPISGEYLNETTFLISPGALEQLQFAWHEGGISRLAMLTDGLQMLALKVADGQPHAPFFDPLFRFIATTEDEPKGQADLAAFLGSDRVQARTDDDLTLLLAAVVG
jgi:hypothetical protein